MISSKARMMRCEGDLVDSCDSRNGVGDDVVVLKLKKRWREVGAAAS
jgi:hypothetical protein